MIILGIETSFDETAVAIVVDGTNVLANVLATSQELHNKTGGAIPETAARKQLEYIIPTIEKAFTEAGVDKNAVDAIAVTYGPGLIGSLLVGVETAKTLACMWARPIIPVNHLVAHLFANFISSVDKPIFPIIGLVVSGGHTDMVLMKSESDIRLLGTTRDDAAGEALDKTARLLLDVGFPGGPAISKAAEPYLEQVLTLFPRPMIHENNYDFSFSGLKTSVINYVQNNPKADKNLLAAEVQEAIVDILVAKSLKAIEQYKPKSFLLAGGVSANKRLREKLQKQIPVDLHLPDLEFTTDNAAMIASAAFFQNNPVPWQEVNANPELSIVG